MTQNRPDWGQELTEEVRQLRTEVHADLKEIGGRVDGYVESLGDLKGSNRTFTTLIFSIIGIILVAIVGGGLWNHSEQKQIIKTVGEHTGTLTSLTSKVEEASKTAKEAADTAKGAVGPIAAEVAGLRDTVAKSKEQVESLGSAAKKLTSDLDELQKRVANVETIKDAVRSLDTASGKATSAISDLRQAVQRMPRGGKEIAVWFQLSSKNQSRPAGDEQRPDTAFYYFDVRVEYDETITVENATEVRAVLSPPQFEKSGIAISDSITCTAKVIRDNVVQIRLSIPAQSSGQMAKHLLSDVAFSGQAFIYLAAR
jgi:hypothetical protein